MLRRETSHPVQSDGASNTPHSFCLPPRDPVPPALLFLRVCDGVTASNSSDCLVGESARSSECAASMSFNASSTAFCETAGLLYTDACSFKRSLEGSRSCKPPPGRTATRRLLWALLGNSANTSSEPKTVESHSNSTQQRSARTGSST